MRVLLSAYSCAPNEGSEPGVGWNWAVEVARLGHDVLVLTTTKAQAEIEAEIETGSLPRKLSFLYHMPPWLRRANAFGWRLGYDSLTEHLSHLVWQWLARRFVRQALAGEHFDVIHHITYGGIRHPSFLGSLPYPFVLGPLGGGERAPFVLRRGLPWKAWISDLVRDLHTWILRFDPITVGACRQAIAIYVKTAQTRTALPARFHPKIVVEMEIGTRRRSAPTRVPRRPDAPFRLFFAGRFLAWKGMDLGIAALAEARRRGVPATLTLCGRGTRERSWRALAENLGVAEHVDWLGWIPFERMGDLYRSHDALLFPSLHDSSGNAVLESLSEGLPVICLDLGGPGTIVNDTCGRVISSAVERPEMCVTALADAIEHLHLSPELCTSLSEGARCRAQDFEWPKPVIRVYEDIERRLGVQAVCAAE